MSKARRRSRNHARHSRGSRYSVLVIDKMRLPCSRCRILAFGISASLALCTYAQSPADWPPPREVDRARAAAVGIREITGKHLRLWTDVPAHPTVDELPRVFDAALPQWAEYYGISPTKWREWQVQGFLILDRDKFAALGLLPERNPRFVNGYALGNELWLDEQASDYYRRHLLLHEGTHSFMLSFLGAAGPGWYMEGQAELWGTHRWEDGVLKLGVLPADRESVPMWGRIKLLRDAVADDTQLSLGEVIAISNRAALAVDAYAWCWALAKFLDSHPRFGERFRKLDTQVSDREFNERFHKLFYHDRHDLEYEWQAFLQQVDYGYDTARMTVEHNPAAEEVTAPATAAVAPDRGWQATPWILRKGQEYRITAEGRYTIAHDGEPWPCEPGGVTIRYHDGHPLGMLLGTLRSTRQPAIFVEPVRIGLAATITPSEDAVLYVRVNDSAAELSDNEGTLTVRIESL